VNLQEVPAVQLPLQITFRGMPHSDSLDTHVRRRSDKLDRLFNRITSCHVVVEVSHRHHRQGKRYRVSINMMLPRGELAVSHAPQDERNLEDAHATVDQAFDEAERQLEDWSRRLRGDVKSRNVPPVGHVTKIFGDRGFGFLETEDGREIYFHRNSVLHTSFDRLEPGTVVRYAEELGDDGPQASTVEVVGR
jgi:ribosomal subunit interface protein